MVTFLMRESPQPLPMIADVMADDGIFSWSRFVTAIVLLGLSVAIGYRTSRDPPHPDAVPQPVHESVVATVELPPLEATTVDALAPLPDVAAPASPARVEATGHVEPRRAGERRQLARAADGRSASRVARPRGHHVARAQSAMQASRRNVRTRAEVRAEYLRHREVVAALTGEDSGSAYLARVAARQRAARLEGAARRRG